MEGSIPGASEPIIMLIEEPKAKRETKRIHLTHQLVVTGGGLSGVCTAITAARAGVKVALVQDRPVLGGNASSEVRLWVLGATSHMGNNNRWAREGGLIDELLLENAYRNPEGNPNILDTILLEKVYLEENITLLLNTAVYDLTKHEDGRIATLMAFCSQNATQYELSAPLFCDASGDGIVGFMAGAAFRMGAEAMEEFGEKFAPSQEYGELLGHSLYFYSKDTGAPVRYVAPAYALSDISKIPRFRSFKSSDFGCRLWWVEYGGRLDTVHDTETIKWELWKVIYGVWNHIKNSGEFPEAENLTLEWVGTIPGKRESRRFEGDYMLKQQDLIEQKTFDDAVAFGGWSIDLHPADGVFSEKPGCNQWHSKGIYGIPYRCLYSRNVDNLFVAGRIISASHVAFGSSRVMATAAHGGQAIGLAAALGLKYNMLPREIGKNHIHELQQDLLKTGQYIPHLKVEDPTDLAQQASTLTASSTLVLQELPHNGAWEPLHFSAAQMLPLAKRQMPAITFKVRVQEPTVLELQLRKSSKPFNHTPDVTLEVRTLEVVPGQDSYQVDFDYFFEEPCYAFVCFMKNERVSLAYSNKRITGILSVFNTTNPAVSNYGKQEPVEDVGVEAFEFWCPLRRPEGKNIALQLDPPLEVFSVENLTNGIQRPVSSTNAWVGAYDEGVSQIVLAWEESQTVGRVELFLDGDYDHPLETVLMKNPETRMPFCADNITLLNEKDQVLAIITDNYLSRRTVEFDSPQRLHELKIVVENTAEDVPNALFEVRCY
ncbi:FAD dependent oxidoreductase [Dyadobacter jejuensis]|uniref:FAD dependent oxidoreductase n=2 Tax=Dyadobacter jejuensis TaxID=1082580 RepID=A0A316AJD6_9BACT|nr:FAD-dependent oxidoreductase [Dyadobacter jejuensis]PWJ57925.1 FAD dependent oxidoreductase [Dyadobacter jejuensis]